MKRVLFVTTISGFLPQFEMNDVKVLQSMGYEVHYASNFNNPMYEFSEEDLIKKGIIIHKIRIEKSPRKFIKNLCAVLRVRKIIDRENIDIIHCHNPMGGVVGRISAQFSKKRPKVIYTAHGLHFYEGAPLINWLVYYPIEKFLANYTDAIVTINKEDYARVRTKFHLREGGFVKQIHGVGVDTTRFCEKKDINAVKRYELGIPIDAFHIVTAAELNVNKNQQVIIKAISQLAYKNVYYSLCGKGSNEEMLKKLIKENDLEDRVRLLGFRNDMEDILQTADLFAFPSYREGLGIAAIEALLCGVPVVAADNRGTREYVRNEINGILVSANNSSEIAEVIKTFVEDSEYRNNISAQCRKTAEIFSIQETMNIMRTVYDRVDKSIVWEC